MKKLLAIILGLFLTLGLFGCVSDDILANAAKEYYATGNFNGWDTKVDGKMTAIARSDERLTASVRRQTRNATALYLFEVTLPATEAGWTVQYKIGKGELTTYDANLTIKVIRTPVGDPDTRDFWAQSPESGEIKNLTPKTMYIPPFIEENVDNAGGWNDNPIAFEAGTYYLVFVEYANNTKAMALIEKP